MSKRTDMHGLAMFISDIRKCQGKDDEMKRVNKELSKIRCKFGSQTVLDGYNKKKYISKLVFIFLLGYDFDFGETIAINLLNSSKYSEKRIGYMFVSVVMDDKSNLMLLVHKAIENELAGYINPEHQILALNYVANMAVREMVDSLALPVLILLFASDTCDTVKQSAILCLLKLFRLKPDIIPENDYPDRIIQFLTYPHLGVVTAAVSLIEALVTADKVNANACLPLIVSKLMKLLKLHSKDYVDYSYYYVSAPWLTVKLLRLLRQFPFPTDIVLKTGIVESIEIIFNKVQEPPKTKKIEHLNSKNAVMFEAINLVHHMNMEPHLQIGACNILEMSLKQREPNIRYLVLETMSLLSESEVCQVRMKEQLTKVIDFFQREKDVCIRRKLTDLLYTLCDQSNVKLALGEMIYYMETEDISLREEIILKISILAEKFLQDRTLYIDIILNVLKGAGEYVPEAVSNRFIQIITNEDAVQSFAAKAAFEALETPRCHENLLSVVGYILGEFGNLIAGAEKFSPDVQLRLLHSKFHLSSKETKATLLTTFMKFANLYPNIQHEIKGIFKNNSTSFDAEIQQRAVEYLGLCEKGHRDTLIRVLEKMPRIKKETFVEDTLQRMKSGTTEISTQKTAKIRRSISFYRGLSNISNIEKKITNKYLANLRCMTMPDLSYINASPDYRALPNVFSQGPKESNAFQNVTTGCLTTNHEALKFVIWQQNGILYESKILRIYTDSNFQTYKGLISFTYTNKTTEVLSNFKPLFPAENFDKIKFEVTPCMSFLKPYETVVQDVNVECMRDFDHKPSLSLSFTLFNFTETIPLFLPLTINKFIAPVTMASEDFFHRWSRCYHTTVKTFPTKNVMERGIVEHKIKGFGLMLLQNVDPNKENFVAAGIFHSKFIQAGILLRLEPDCKTCTYQLTVRSTLPTVSEEVAKLVIFIL